jgi:hypothetical protein
MLPPNISPSTPPAEYLPTEVGGGGGGVGVHHLRGVLPRTWDDPLTLELAGVAALYAQCVRVRVRVRVRVKGAPNPNPNPSLTLTRCVDGLWLLSYSHPFSAHQAFCLGLRLGLRVRVEVRVGGTVTVTVRL